MKEQKVSQNRMYTNHTNRMVNKIPRHYGSYDKYDNISKFHELDSPLLALIGSLDARLRGVM